MDGTPGPRRKLALIVEYEGTRYAGFQFQPNAPTIQGELEQALERLTGEHVKIQAASRTDAGVHALGQVVAFQTGAGHMPETFVRGLNFYLPQDVRVQSAYEVEEDFHPRADALRREYRYLLLNTPSPSALWRASTYHVPHPLDTVAMAQATQCLVGTHDFAPFCGELSYPGASTVRHLYQAEVLRKGRVGSIVLVRLAATAFLPQQVRRIAGALLQVGLGKMSTGEFFHLARTGQRGAAALALPARGLYLVGVTYAGFPPQGAKVQERSKERNASSEEHENVYSKTG